MNVVAVFLLGMLGGVFRCIVPASGLYGTLLINLIGTFAFGFFTCVAQKTNQPDWIRVGVGAGLLGSFTTFSGFIGDTESLAMSHVLFAGGYAVLCIAGGLLCCHLGNWMGHIAGGGHRLQPQSNNNHHDAREQSRTLT